jgi:hypothetical protein
VPSPQASDLSTEDGDGEGRVLRRGTPGRYVVLTMTVTEAQRELCLDHPDVVYRLARAGILKARKVGRVWNIDPASVEARKRAVQAKRSSKLNAAGDRERRMAEAEAMFA